MVVAMKSIKFHAVMRERSPIYGCLVEIHHLTYQIQAVEEELHAVLQHLAYYWHQHQTPSSDEFLSDLQLGMAPPGDDLNSPFHSNDNNTNSTVMCQLLLPQQMIMSMLMQPLFDNIEEGY